MRFLIFNVVVGLALVYLINGGEMPVGGFKESLAAAERKADAAVEGVKRQLLADAPKPDPAANAQPKADPKGHARDVIPETEPAAPAKRRAPAKRAKTPPPPPPPPPGSETADAKTPPALPEAKTVGARPVHTINEADALVAKRRDEVLGTAPARAGTAKVALKEGTSLMSARERRRQLDRLAEEMELLYLEKVGG